jgi:hypothetical protein
LGWCVALDLVWEANPILEKSLSKLVAVLKDNVKGRHEDAFVSLTSVVVETQLPENWVLNAMDGNLIEHRFKIKGAQWASHVYKGAIRIPLDFGLKPL